ncbi:hypothetical protein [Rhizobium sp. BK376]|uniref:hypothetical protein n=1 Tax=Rhizobium sp. BK376 TaxID=2512149 RepID=UPI0010474B83|nr:hypothetical protein [Rhizobium sp. BK376]TCR67906.1 hypothetical protein EV561_1463 [Rhizobium sp. BK376]
MKKFILAAALALASIAATAIPSNAASVVVTTDNGHYGRHYDHRDHYRRDYWRHHHRHCYTKKITRWHHGHKVVRRERVCR